MQVFTFYAYADTPFSKAYPSYFYGLLDEKEWKLFEDSSFPLNKLKRCNQSRNPSLHESINNWCNEFQYLVIENKPFMELFSHENVSLWPFVKEPMLSKLRNNLVTFDYFLETYQTFSINNQIDKVCFISNLSVGLSEFVNYFCNQNNISFEFINTSNEIEECKSSFDRLPRKELKKYIQSKTDRNYQKNRVLLTNVWSTEAIDDSGLTDHYMHLFYKYFREKEVDCYRFLLPIYPKQGRKDYIDNCLGLTTYYENIFFDEFLDDDIYSGSEKYLKKFRELYFRLTQNRDFISHFKWKSYSILDAFSVFLEEVFTRQIVFNGVYALKQAKVMLDILEPHKIFLTMENLPYARAIIIEAQKKGIQTIGVQHGIIPKQNWYYLDGDSTSQPFQQNDSCFKFITANKTLVFGQYYKQILATYGGYDSHSIEVLPNWIELSKNLKSKSKHSQCNLNLPNSFVLLITSVFAMDALSSIIEKHYGSGMPIVVKMHHRDTVSQHLLDLIDEYDSEVIITRENYYQLIENAKVIYSNIDSTTSLDVLLKNKRPLIYGSHSNYDIPWKKYCLGFEAQVSTPLTDIELAQVMNSFGGSEKDEKEFLNQFSEIMEQSSNG